MRSNRYAFLDGIRGVAAIFILTRHTLDFWGWYFYFYRSYLAVDIFFILSGFVIAHAYDEKIKNGTLSFQEFIKIRLIRLYPVFFLSLLICSAVSICINGHANWETFRSILLAALFLPSRTGWSNDLFPVNGPYWSLLFELIINALYAKIRSFLTDLVLSAIVIVSGLIVALIAYHHGNLDVGFSWSLESFIAGLSRSIFGIFIGLLLYRHHVIILNRFGKFLSPWFALFAVAVILSSANAEPFNWIIDAAIVTFVFPVLVLAASKDSTTKWQTVLLTLGAASYPMYVLHKPIGEILNYGLRGIVSAYAPVSGIIFVITLVLLSVLIEKQYDIPIRRWISKRVLKIFKTR